MGNNNYFCYCERSEAQAYVDDYFDSLLIVKKNFLLDPDFIKKLKELSTNTYDDFIKEYIKSDDGRYDLIHFDLWKSAPQHVFENNFKYIIWAIIMLSYTSSTTIKADLMEIEEMTSPKIKREKVMIAMAPFICFISIYANTVLNEKSKGHKPKDLKDLNMFYQQSIRTRYLARFLKIWEMSSQIDLNEFFANLDDNSKMRVKMENLYRNT